MTPVLPAPRRPAPVSANVWRFDLRPPGAAAAIVRRAAAWARLAGPAAVDAVVDRETRRWRCPVCGVPVPPEAAGLGALSSAEGDPPELHALLETPPAAPPDELWFGVCAGCAPTTQAGWDTLAGELRALVGPA